MASPLTTITGLIELLLADAVKKADAKTQLTNPGISQAKHSVRPSEAGIETNSEVVEWQDVTRPPLPETHGVRTRYIPVAIKRAVYARDKGQCSFPGCKSRHYLEYDHITPFAFGGAHSVENLRLSVPAARDSVPLGNHNPQRVVGCGHATKSPAQSPLEA